MATGSLVTGIDNLCSLFTSFSSDLENLGQQLEHGENSAVSLLRRIRKLENRIPGLIKDAELVMAEKQIFMDQAVKCVLESSDILRRHCGDEIETAEYSTLKELSRNWDDEMLGLVGSNQVTNTNVNLELAKTNCFSKKVVSEPLEADKENSEEIISEKDFEELSTMVRGRSKREDVLKLYKIIQHYYKTTTTAKGKPKPPLSIKQLYKLGENVTGQTGQAKLKSLVALKLIVRKNDTITLPKPKA